MKSDINEVVLNVLREYDTWLDEEVIAEQLLELGHPADRKSILRSLGQLVMNGSATREIVNGLRIYKALSVHKSPEQSAA